LHERAARTAEFARWSKSDALVRGMRDGALVGLDHESVDELILAAIPSQRLLFARAVGHAMASIDDFMASDVLVASRIRREAALARDALPDVPDRRSALWRR
jgi:hypothetical protein